MSKQPKTEFKDGFEQKLAELRLRIDALPEPQRVHLYKLADVIAQRQQYLQKRMVHKYDGI